jgi:DNA-binding GntR family transcriptional regulator
MLGNLSTPAYQRVREKMLADIAAGLWPIGTHLTLAELERRYGVSQSPIREALLHLAGDGVVMLRAHRGAALPPLDRRTLGELYAVRAALQALTARQAAARATPASLKPVRDAAEAHATAAEALDFAAIAETNRAFHAAIDNLSQNRMAIAMLEARGALVDAVRLACGYGEARPRRAAVQHKAILSALARRDADRAGHLAEAHALESWRDLEARLPPQDTEGGNQ